MPSQANRDKAIAELEAAYQALAEECQNDGDLHLEVFAEYPKCIYKRRLAQLAATVGYRYALVRRNEMRSDNA